MEYKLMNHDYTAIDIESITPLDVGSGCTRRNLSDDGIVRVWVVDIEPGGQWPQLDTHGEHGETVLVLSGEIIEGDRRFGAGTYFAHAPHSQHQPRSDIGVRLFGFNRML